MVSAEATSECPVIAVREGQTVSLPFGAAVQTGRQGFSRSHGRIGAVCSCRWSGPPARRATIWRSTEGGPRRPNSRSAIPRVKWPEQGTFKYG